MRNASEVIRFGVFEVDLRTGELRRHGLRVRLPSQSFQVLQLLLEHPGGMVSRKNSEKALAGQYFRRLRPWRKRRREATSRGLGRLGRQPEIRSRLFRDVATGSSHRSKATQILARTCGNQRKTGRSGLGTWQTRDWRLKRH